MVIEARMRSGRVSSVIAIVGRLIHLKLNFATGSSHASRAIRDEEPGSVALVRICDGIPASNAVMQHRIVESIGFPDIASVACIFHGISFKRRGDNGFELVNIVRNAPALVPLSLGQSRHSRHFTFVQLWVSE